METFQFTHPGRGATPATRVLATDERVSIHAPREGCDTSHSILVLREQSFNSRTPGGVRLAVVKTSEISIDVSIHAPREGYDSVVQSCVLWGG